MFSQLTRHTVHRIKLMRSQLNHATVHLLNESLESPHHEISDGSAHLSFRFYIKWLLFHVHVYTRRERKRKRGERRRMQRGRGGEKKTTRRVGAAAAAEVSHRIIQRMKKKEEEEKKKSCMNNCLSHCQCVLWRDDSIPENKSTPPPLMDELLCHSRTVTQSVILPVTPVVETRARNNKTKATCVTRTTSLLVVVAQVRQ